jgi:hypothetical protein
VVVEDAAVVLASVDVVVVLAGVDVVGAREVVEEVVVVDFVVVVV